MGRDVVFDLGGVVFRWEPLVLLQQLFAQRMPDEASARHWAGQIFQTFAPEADWALFDLGQIEPDALAQRISQRISLRGIAIDDEQLADAQVRGQTPRRARRRADRQRQDHRPRPRRPLARRDDRVTSLPLATSATGARG